MHSCKGARPDAATAGALESMERTEKTKAVGCRVPWARVVSVLVAALLIVSQASSLAHALLVEHAVCPQHGEWMHADELAAHAGGSGAKADRAGRPTLQTALPPAEGHEHEHCAVLSERRQSGAAESTSPADSMVFGADQTVACLTGGATEAQSVPLLRLAPKNSPPL